MDVCLYAFRWTSPTTQEWQAVRDGRFGRKPLQVGQDLSLKITSPRQCAGSVRDDLYKPCAHQATGRRQCEACRAREGQFIFTSFDGFNTSHFTNEDLERISGEHVVYLALFDKHLVKVGVSKLERKAMRQLEQGSHFTLFIAQTPDGTSARQIETLFRHQGLTDKIAANAKKNFLCPDITPQVGQSQLRQTLKDCQNALGSEPHLKNFLLPEPEFADWGPTYGLDNTQASTKHFHAVKLDIGESVAGKVLTVKGPFLVIETPDELVQICVKDLLGHQIDFTPQAPHLTLNQALQNSLF